MLSTTLTSADAFAVSSVDVVPTVSACTDWLVKCSGMTSP